MFIRPIQPTDWPHIMAIQANCYGPDTLETQPVLNSKVLFSRQTCLVAVIDQQIAAYVLAHSWPLFDAPKLNVELFEQSSPSHHTKTSVHDNELCLYIHDLAVHHAFQHQGVAKRLFTYLRAQSQIVEPHKLALISLPSALPFWQKMGFVNPTNIPQPLLQSLNSYPANSHYLINPKQRTA